MGWGELPASPGGSPPQIPLGPLLSVPPSQANHCDDVRTVSDRPRGRPQRRDALRAQAPESRTSARTKPTCLPPDAEGRNRRSTV
jgi:hypothetical protein